MQKGTLIPAYGRDYKSAKVAVADFVAGKDFELTSPLGSGYCSIRDFKPGDSFQIRYRKLTQVALYVVTGLEPR